MEKTPRNSARLSLASASVSSMSLLELGDHAGADRGVPLGAHGAMASVGMPMNNTSSLETSSMARQLIT